MCDGYHKRQGKMVLGSSVVRMKRNAYTVTPVEQRVATQEYTTSHSNTATVEQYQEGGLGESTVCTNVLTS